MKSVQHIVQGIFQFLLRYPSMGKFFSNIFGFIEVPILEFRRIVDRYLHSGFYEKTESIFIQIYGSRIIPINSSLKGVYNISPTEEILSIIQRIPSLAIGYCYCRTTHKNCNNPLWTCIHVGTAKKLSDIGRKTAIRPSTYEEVEKLLYKADELGLIHQLITAPNKDYFYVICNCCPCCCSMLEAAKRMKKKNVVLKSNFIAVLDETKCENCGNCVSYCHFKARDVFNGILLFDSSSCVGCGLCIKSCRSNAIYLKRRNETKQN